MNYYGPSFNDLLNPIELGYRWCTLDACINGMPSDYMLFLQEKFFGLEWWCGYPNSCLPPGVMPTPVPEPASWLLMAAGVIGLLFMRRGR